MTACVNKNHGRRVAGVVTASLVGALTLGGVSLAAVPTVALAEQGSLQSTDEFTNAKLTAAEDGQGNDLKSLENISFEKGAGKYLVPTELTGDDGTVYPINEDNGEYTLSYHNDTLGTDVSDANRALITNYAGDYSVTVTSKKTGAQFTAKFSIVNPTLEGAYAFDDSLGYGDTSDTSFTYTGADQSFSIRFADKYGKLITGATVTYYDAKGNVAAEVKDAGDYAAKVTKDGKTVEVKFTVAKLDLANAGLSAADTATFSSATTPEGALLPLVSMPTAGNLSDILQVTSVTNPNGGSAIGADGAYSFTVASKVKDDPNVTGTATLSFHKVKTFYKDVYYGSQPVSSTLNVSLEDGESYDQSKLKFSVGDDEYLKGDALEASYTDAKTGKAVDASALSKKGTYRVSLRVKAFQKDGVWYGGYKSFTVNVVAGKADANKVVTFKYDGKVIDSSVASVKKVYDGADALKSLSVTVTDSDGDALKEGTDYELVVKDSNGQKADALVNAGDYTVEVNPLTFDWKNANAADYTLQVRVGKVDLKTLKAAEDVTYTGSDVEVPDVKYAAYDYDGNPVLKSGRQVWKDLSTDLYKVTRVEQQQDDGTWKVVEKANKNGLYRATVKLNDDAKANYKPSANTFEFRVVAYKSFSDVPKDYWGAKAIYTAASDGYKYMNGIAGTGAFAPEASIKRADAVVTLYNMAGGNTRYADNWFTKGDNNSYETGFSDVDETAYYARALAWAHTLGIATGDAGTTNFRPDDTVSRQEFAALLYKYAQRTGGDLEAEDGALGKLSDASTVDGWATEAVNWAVSQGVMGNGGYVAGKSSVKRAEVAAMSVNYQPDGALKKALDKE